MKIEIDVEESWLATLQNIFSKKCTMVKCGMSEYNLVDNLTSRVIDAMIKVRKDSKNRRG